MPARHPPHDLVIRLIAVFKLVKAATLIVVGVGALSLRHDRLGALGDWVDALVFDPHGRYLHAAVAKLGGLNGRELGVLGIGSLVYAALFAVEGVGLMLRRVWAEVLTVVITTSFIPLEIYELSQHRSWAKATVIAVNAAVVGYLVRRLRRERHGALAAIHATRP